MHTLTTLYFPGTEIYSFRQFPLLLLFAKLHLLKPVENVQNQQDKTVSDIFIKSGFCQVHTPLPLGSDRDRFLHLMRDIEERRDSYAAQLSGLTLASMSEKKHLEGESEVEILNSLQGKKATVKRDDSDQERLWQSRLILAIAELLDREEEEIALRLTQLEDDESDLYHAIRGELQEDEDENPFDDLIRINTNLGTGHGGNMRKRFRAWRTLYQAGTVPAPHILLTISREVAELLLEEVEQKTGVTSPIIANYDLPAFIGWNHEEAVETIAAFHSRHSDLLAELGACHTELGKRADSVTCSNQQRLNEAWNEQIAITFPAHRYGRLSIQSYLLAGVTNHSLLNRLDESAQTGNSMIMTVG